MPEFGHVPLVVAGAVVGQWQVFCDACSAEAEDYVPRCEFADQNPGGWPPRALYEDEPPKQTAPLSETDP